MQPAQVMPSRSRHIFNASIIQQIKRRLSKDFKAMPFSQVDLASSVKSSVYGADFERSIMQTITSGNKSQITVNKKTTKNRLSSQLLDRKNQLSIYSTLRQVTTTSADSAKQSERANVMRRVHMSFLGYICVIHSSDGEKVGINKQIAIFSSILGATSSDVIKDKLLADKDIIPLNDTNASMIDQQSLRNVYVNGEWIGCTIDSLKLVNKYRQFRRDFTINPLTTIYWDNTQDEVFFWVDVGRPVRPLMIVYNNKRDPDKFKKKYVKKKDKSNFTQGIGVSRSILDGLKNNSIDVNYLLKNNIIEYITPEEQENCYISPFYDQLNEDKNNELREYTHCDIPQAILGITALTSPFANHNQPNRLTFQTSQGKQTCGVFALNWPYRCDKNTFLQYVCETPLVKTVATKYIFPNGGNCIVAIQSYSGYNVEDSLIISQGAVDRGFFNGSKVTFVSTELDQREDFGNPDIATTEDIKTVSYANLTDGIISVGEKLTKGDAVIGKLLKIPKTDKGMTKLDKSIIYKSNEDAIVSNVIVDRNENDEKFVKVCLRKNRPVQIGDKFSVKGDVEVLTNLGWKFIKNIDINKHKVATLKRGAIEYVSPTGLSTYEYDGDMYTLKTDRIQMCVTTNHKLYVRPGGHKSTGREDQYELIRAHEVFGKNVIFKKNAINAFRGYHNIHLHAPGSIRSVYPMDAWLEFISDFISWGKIDQINKYVIIDCASNMPRRYNYLKRLKIDTSGLTGQIICLDSRRYPAIYLECLRMWTQTWNERLPDYTWNLSQTQAQLFISYLTADIYHDKYHANYTTHCIKLANDISRLALHAGWSARIALRSYDSGFNVGIVKVFNYPEINGKQPQHCVERYEKFNGTVYCLEIPDTHTHVYYMRDNLLSSPHWSGNSSRAGQKGVCGVKLRDSDMPSTASGIRPEIIMNPHAIPSRMTVGQLYESQIGNWCAAKGTHTNATIFKKIDIESIGDELESMGLNRYGYHRLYSGITGEYIDAEIFMGPTYYQRLQKFVIDSVYSISQGPTDSLTHQQLDGKTAQGGIRIGEMERDCICARGASKFLGEKFFDHSDGYTEYICRCGKSAIVNVKKKYLQV